MGLGESQMLDTTLKKDTSLAVLITVIYFIVFQISTLVSSVVIVFCGNKNEVAKNYFLNNSGIPYFWGIGLGMLVILVGTKYKSDFRVNTEPLKKMTYKIFFSLVVVVMATQIILGIYSLIFEKLVNMIGVSAISQVKEATGSSKTLSMLLYASFLGPIAEELVFRGFLLNNLKKHGQGFAIFVSAYMFGLYHSNFIQTPFAFIVGLLFGYVALTYGIKWSIGLHIFNNFVLGDFLSYVLRGLGSRQINLISDLLVIFGGLTGFVILWVNRKKIYIWYQNNALKKSDYKMFFTRKIVIIVTVIIFIIACLGLDKL